MNKEKSYGSDQGTCKAPKRRGKWDKEYLHCDVTCGTPQYAHQTWTIFKWVQHLSAPCVSWWHTLQSWHVSSGEDIPPSRFENNSSQLLMPYPLGEHSLCGSWLCCRGWPFHGKPHTLHLGLQVEVADTSDDTYRMGAWFLTSILSYQHLGIQVIQLLVLLYITFLSMLQMDIMHSPSWELCGRIYYKSREPTMRGKFQRNSPELKLDDLKVVRDKLRELKRQ